MGLIRKAASVSTLGGVKYTSKREAQTKAAAAQARAARQEARLLKAQARQARRQPPPGAPDIEALTARMERLTGLHEAGVLTDAEFETERKALGAASLAPAPVAPVKVTRQAKRTAAAEAAPAPTGDPVELKGGDLSFREALAVPGMIKQARRAGVRLSKPEARALIVAGHTSYPLPGEAGDQDQDAAEPQDDSGGGGAS